MKNKTKDEQADYICDLIENLLNSLDSESGDKQAFTEMIIVHSAIYGSSSAYEGIGILSNSISSYKSICDDVLFSDSNS